MISMPARSSSIRKTLAGVSAVLALLTAACVHAQDLPAGAATVTPVAGGTGTTTSIEFDPLIEMPPPTVLPPEPIVPSRQPTGYVKPIEPLPLDDIGLDAVDIDGDNLRVISEEGRAVLATADNARVRFRETLTTANTARIDFETSIALFDGSVIFRIRDQEVYGESLTLNLRTREWLLRRASTAVEPQFAGGYLNAPVFAEGETIEGIGRSRLSAVASATTTCNLEDPHYELVSRSITVYPERRLVLRDTTVFILGRRIVTIPRLVIPLREIQQNPNLIPRFGQSAEEGVFVKTTYSLFGDAERAGYLLLDLMSKKGVGTGARYNYQLNDGLGQIQLYRLEDRSTNLTTLTGHLNHRQRFGTVEAQLTSNLRDNSYIYAPQSRSFNNQLTLTRQRANASTSLVINQATDNLYIQTRRLNGNLIHRQQLANDIILDSNFIYDSYNGTNQSSVSRLTSQALLQRSEEKFDWVLSTQLLTDFTDDGFSGTGRFAGIERLPELSLISDSSRLGYQLPGGIRTRYRLSVGHYNELPADTSLTRAYFEMEAPATQRQISDKWSLTAGGAFKQFVYSDNTAQYVLSTSAALRRNLGQNSTLDLYYRLQKPEGFSPFRFDYIGDYNSINANLNLRETERFRFSLLTGYNFKQKAFPWQDVTLRFSVQPNDDVLLYTSTGYDINRSEWRSVVNQLRLRLGENFRLDVGSRYDPTMHRFALVRSQLDTLLDAKTRLQAVLGYNGFTRSYDYKSLMLTRDLHCWEASLVYTDQSGFFEDQSLMFYLRIKAFPMFQQFGIGPFGQLQDTSVGQIY